MSRRTVLTLLVVSLVLLAGCSGLSNSPDSAGDDTTNGTAIGAETATQAAGATTAQPTAPAETTERTAMATTRATTMATAAPTATATHTAARTATPTATGTPTATETATPTATATATSADTETATPTATATATSADTETATATPTATATETATSTAAETATSTAADTGTPTATGTATPTSTGTSTPTSSKAAIGPEPPLDGNTIAGGHEKGLRAAENFVVNASMTRRASGESDTNTRNARVDLADDAAHQVSHPTEKATRYTYAEGSTAYKKEAFSGLDPKYEVDDLGSSLAERLTAGGTVAATVRAIDYERSGTVTRDGDELAVYVANGTEAVDTSGSAFHGEDITAFSSTLVLDPDTGVVRELRTTRETDYLSGNEPATIEETFRFSNLGSTDVEKPGWVSQAKKNAGDS